MRRIDSRHSALFLLVVIAACAGGPRSTGPDPVVDDPNPPAIHREMRGVWIATVANIDWPSSRTLTADQQRAELVDLMSRAATAGFNTIVFQVRPAGDAVYASTIEPWASLLSGTQGTNPGYDPLEFAVQEAHARGMELHAWVNPFRAHFPDDTSRIAASHIARRRPDLVVR